MIRSARSSSAGGIVSPSVLAVLRLNLKGSMELLADRDPEEARKLLVYHSRLIVWLGEALMRADQPEDALAQAERALALTRERGERGLEASALWLLGELASRRERPEVEAAVSHYRRAMALGDALGMRPLIAHCHGGLAKLYRRTGHALEAQAHFKRRDDHVPRDGHAVLAGEGGGGDPGVGMRVVVLTVGPRP